MSDVWISDLSPRLECVLLSPALTGEEVERACEGARGRAIHAVCVASAWVAMAVRLLRGSGVRVVSYTGLPHGATDGLAKAFEAGRAADLGAEEIEMVLNLGLARAGEWDAVRRDVADVRAVTDGKILKVILEPALLGAASLDQACGACVDAGADMFVDRSGLRLGAGDGSSLGALRDAVAGRLPLKVTAAARTPAQVQALLDQGAHRVGTPYAVVLE
jgi:deoxyribose-phosphate aldolase